jgi:ParB family chromosome partitioning protein
MSTAALKTAGPAEFEIVPIERLHESKTNPRQHFAKDSLAELAKSVTEKGILVPLLVRRRTDDRGTVQELLGYEIVAGARRYRAAKTAGLETIPVLIRNLDDLQALEVQVIENLQRADVHPLEEAEGYRQLLANGKYDIEALAAKVGKSTRYIYARIQLAQLAPAAKKAFEEDEITAGHAILLARLQPKDQLEILKEAEHDGFGSVRDLAHMIQRNYHLELSQACFPTGSAELVPAAGACPECPKRTGFNKTLFHDVQNGNQCTDARCFHEKETAFVKIQVGTHPEAVMVSLGHSYNEPLKGRGEHDWKPAGKAKCQDTGEAVIVQWEGRVSTYGDKKGLKLGQVLNVCINPSKCKTHRPEDFYDSSRGVAVNRSKERKTRALEAARVEALTQIAAKVKTWDLNPVAVRFANRSTFEGQKLACKALGIWPADGKTGGFDFRKKLSAYIRTLKSPRELSQILAVLTLIPEYGKWGDGYHGSVEIPLLHEAGKTVGVDVKKIERDYVKAANAKAKKKAKTVPAVQASAGKKRRAKKAA